jgi:hypothetical protein
MAITRGIKAKIENYGLNVPTDKRTRRYQQILKENNWTETQYETYLKQLVKKYDTKTKQISKDVEKNISREQQFTKVIRDNYFKSKIQSVKNLQSTFRRNRRTKYINDIKNAIFSINNGNKKSFTITQKDIKRNSSLSEILELVLDNFDNSKNLLFIESNGKNYTLTPENIRKLNDIVNTGDVSEIEDYAGGSDAQIVLELIQADNFKISSVPKTNKYKFREGAFFPYYINPKIEIDLRQFQLFKKETLDTDADRNLENCLLYSLKEYGIPQSQLESLKHLIKQKHVPLCDLKTVCDRLEICIILHHYRSSIDSRHKNRTRVFGDKYIPKVDIGYIENHYFLIKETKYTSYSIKNYDTIKDLKDWNKIVKKRTDGNGYLRDENRYINSFDVISLMLQNKDYFFTKINAGNVNAYDEVYLKKLEQNNFESLEYTDKDYRLLEKQETKLTDEEEAIINDLDNTDDIDDRNKEHFLKYYRARKGISYQVVHFDFETNPYVDSDGSIKIEPYLCCSEDDDRIRNSFIGEDCGLQLLKSLKTNTTLVAHNAKFDYNFLTKYLYQCKEICNGGAFISFTGKFNGLKIQIKDSYKLIPMPLKKFPASFKLTCHKEYMPYHIYTRDNVRTRYIDYDYIIKNITNDNDKTLFIENIVKWNCLKNDKVDIIEYSRRYCEIDVEVLRKGYEIFRQNCLTHFDIDINKILTIPSLADKYFINQDCYEGIYELAGQPRSFIEKCIVGGRTMVKCNSKIAKYNVIINDFDAVSLYPSAMNRIDGFLKGLPKIISDLDYNAIKNYDGYFVEIEINKVGIKRNFPLMSVLDENGIKNFTNDVEGVRIFTDKTALEDMIKFHQIEFKIIKGYYFDEGFNTKIKDVIRYIFDKRKQLKKEGNTSEMIYKLIMNSGYGKTIQKPHIKEIKLFDNKEKFDVYLSRNYNRISNWLSYDNDTKFKVEVSTNMNSHFNRAHIGVSILSMSKRIMNEVICLAEDNNLTIYYQDTDSIHIEDKDIEVLQQLFTQNYDKELIGKDLGQFHSDFELKGATKDVVATDSIFLGKKSYIDCLEGYDDEGNKVNGYHIRMKGISNDSIMYYCKEHNITPFQLYQELYDGKKIEFDLTCGGSKVNFRFNKDYTIEDLSSFNRSVCFV